MIEMELPRLSRSEEYVLCGEASNGAEALDKIEKLRPDVVISDMKMPVMDGLALCRCCRERFPQCAFLVLSNYDDFAYVKETLLLGASDYLLKHSLDAESLLKVLEKIARNGATKDKERTDVSLTALRERAIRNLLSGVYVSERQIATDIEAFELFISMHRVVPVMMWIRDYQGSDFAKNSKLSFSIINIVGEILEEQRNGVICYTNHGQYAILLCYEEIRSEQKTREHLLFSLNRIRLCMSNFLGVETQFIIGRMQPSILNVSEEYRALESAFQSHFYQEKDVWLSDFNFASGEEQVRDIFSSEDEKRLVYELVSGNAETASELMKTYLGKILEGRPSETVCKMIFTRILGCLKRAMEACSIKTDDILRDEYSEESILRISSYRQSADAIQTVCSRLLEEKGGKNTAASSYMQKAVAYIHRHFRENISQTDVAEHVGISAVYLSVLFKNEMKDSFPGYLRSIRLKEAAHLLERGSTNIKEVAEQSGFQDYTYFLKCFKREFSVTPKEYVQRMRLP